MPHRHKDEISKLDDIEALVALARDLTFRFRGADLNEVGVLLQDVLNKLNDARSAKIAKWQRERSSH
jgi:hypothetical protein